MAKIKALSIAHGYKNDMGEDNIKTHVGYKSKTYAFLEVERREFHPVSGLKISKPQIVSFNNHDLLNFIGKVEKRPHPTERGKTVDHVVIVSQKTAQGLSVNAVFHIPSTFGLSLEADDWTPKANQEEIIMANAGDEGGEGGEE